MLTSLAIAVWTEMLVRGMPGGEPSQRFQVDQLHVHGDPDAHLPTSSTCFFSLHWPAYTTAAAAKEKLLYALYNCRDMDLN